MKAQHLLYASSDEVLVVRDKRETPFFQLGNEILDVFQPIIGPECLAVYSHLVRRAFRDPELSHSILDLKEKTGLGATTVSRSLELLEYVGLIQRILSGGSQKSKCKLLDSENAAKRLGAQYAKRTLSWSLQDSARERLQGAVEEIRERQQGKRSGKVSNAYKHSPYTVSQRHSGLAPEESQPAARETQPSIHLIQEEDRIKESSTPTPPPVLACQAQNGKGPPDEVESDANLQQWARVKFTAVIDDLADHLFDTSRPPLPNLSNGAGDWNKYGFGSLAIHTAAQRGSVLELTITAGDPTSARLGLEKYYTTWKRSLQKWFECELTVHLVPAFLQREEQEKARTGAGGDRGLKDLRTLEV